MTGSQTTGRQPRATASRVPASVVAALALAFVFFVPLVPLVGVVLATRAARTLARATRGRRLALAALIVGAVMTAAQVTAAAIVLPRLGRLMRSSRAAEGPMALGVMRAQLEARGAKRPLPRGDTGWTPRTPCCRQSGRRCRNQRADWGHAIWRELDFRAYGRRHSFQYRYRSADGERALFEARADLDCDGVSSRYQLSVRRRRGTLGFSRRVERPEQ